MSNLRLPPMHPGEVLREEYMKPYRLTPYKLASICRIPRTRIERIAREETGITADTALRLAKVFRTTPVFWMNLQSRYEVEKVKGERAAEIDALKEIEPRLAVA
ncbi:MAG TPA: HigA family addiction module antitoxin [Aestuariivirgaceae bacterium]|nr:HigA family addiction module antitoxin [Aestuariivirgaceae bacterium]